MIINGTPVEDHTAEFGLIVKREDLSCPPPGPPFSKTRGVYAHLQKREEDLIGVLDTYHSQAGHAVATACLKLGKECVNFYPEYKGEPGYRGPQQRAVELGASVEPLKAGRSAVLFHQAKRLIEERGGYMMPNALKLSETVSETAAEVRRSIGLLVLACESPKIPWLISVSSGTIAAGVIRGVREQFEILSRRGLPQKHSPAFLLHMGYSRSIPTLGKYVREKSGWETADLLFVDEGYGYKDRSKRIWTLPFPANEYYDMKTIDWWMKYGRDRYDRAVLWLIG